MSLIPYSMRRRGPFGLTYFTWFAIIIATFYMYHQGMIPGFTPASYEESPIQEENPTPIMTIEQPELNITLPPEDEETYIPDYTFDTDDLLEIDLG